MEQLKELARENASGICILVDVEVSMFDIKSENPSNQVPTFVIYKNKNKKILHGEEYAKSLYALVAIMDE